MKLKLRYSAAYLKQARKIAEKNPQLRQPYTELLDKLSDDPFEPTLHTHPLKGKLKGKYACSLTHSLRIVFELGNDFIALIDIGSHDEVY